MVLAGGRLAGDDCSFPATPARHQKKLTPMHYVSTRGAAPVLNFEEAMLTGLARDGGLYVPQNIPQMSHADIAALEGLSYEETAFRVMRPFVGDVFTDQEFGDLIEDSEAVKPEESVTFTILQEQLMQVLGGLTNREADVIKARYGLTDGQPKTLDEIGKVHGVTRERIRQIESKTMSKLRHPSRSQSLRDYLD